MRVDRCWQNNEYIRRRFFHPNETRSWGTSVIQLQQDSTGCVKDVCWKFGRDITFRVASNVYKSTCKSRILAASAASRTIR